MAARFCPACRSVIQDTDQFCTSCGATLSVARESPQATNSTGRSPRRWLKWGGIGCGGVIALFIILVIIGLVIGEESDEQEDSGTVGAVTSGSSPTPLVPIDPRVIWDDYLSNETNANKTWKGDWLLLRMGPIDEIEDGGRVLIYMDEFGWNHIELDFKNDDDVLDLRRGDTGIVECKLSGFELDSWLNFKDCRYAE